MSLAHMVFASTPVHELRRLERERRKSLGRSLRRHGRTRDRVRELEQDVGYLTLVLAAVLARLDEGGTLSRAELLATLREVDELDGVADGRLDVRILRGATAEGPTDGPERAL